KARNLPANREQLSPYLRNTRRGTKGTRRPCATTANRNLPIVLPRRHCGSVFIYPIPTWTRVLPDYRSCTVNPKRRYSAKGTTIGAQLGSSSKQWGLSPLLLRRALCLYGLSFAPPATPSRALRAAMRFHP